MDHWDLCTLDVEPHKPQILHSQRGETRSIAFNLPAGDLLQEHEVHERCHLIVLDGELEVEQEGETVVARAGFLAIFDPGERREVRARADSRFLYVLAPWPGPGHPGARDD